MPLSRLTKTASFAGLIVTLMAFAWIERATAIEPQSSSSDFWFASVPEDDQSFAGMDAPLGRSPQFLKSLEAQGSAAPSIQNGALAPALAASFIGIGMEADDDEFFHSPPDTHAATGLDRIVEVTNGHVAIYNKSGGLIAGGDSGPGAVDLDAFCGQEGCFDPKVIYDQESDRFVAVILEGFDSDDTWLHIMVSKTSSPANLTSDWDKFRHSATATISSTAGAFDYPGLGVSPDAVVVTGNVFSDVSLPLGTKIRVFDKAELYDGDTTATFVDIDRSLATGGFTRQPAHHLSAPPSGTFYLFQGNGASGLVVTALTGIPGSPVVNESFLSTADQGVCVSAATQQGTLKTIDTVCPRMMNAVYRNGSLWGTLTGSNSSDSRAVVQWFEVETHSFPSSAPSIRQHGAIDSGAGEHTFMPSISVDSCGNAAVTYTQSSSNRYPEMRYTARQAGDTLNTMQAPAVAKTSVSFHDDFTSNAERWGDYSSTVIDPADDSFWITHEYVRVAATGGGDNSRWGTWHANFAVACDPATPTPTATPTNTATSTDTPTPTETHTSTPEPSATATETHTFTPEPSSTATETHTLTPEPSDTPTATHTFTPVPSATATQTHTFTPEPSATPTETHTPTPEPSATPTETNTPIPAPTDTHTPTAESDPAPTETNTPTPESSDTPTETHTPTLEPSATPTETHTPTPEPSDTPTETQTPTPEPSFTPTMTHTPTPESSATPTETHTPTPEPSDTPTETQTPTPEPSFTPTMTHTPTPESSATPTETHTPTPEPSDTPTETQTPTPDPSPPPSNTPTTESSPTPSLTPTLSSTSPSTATNTQDPSPTASAIPSGTLTPSATATSTPTQQATTTHTPTSEGDGEGLDLEGAAAATGTALAEFEKAVAATSTALAEVAARPADQIVGTGPSSSLRELCIALGLPLPAIVLGRGVAYLIWRRQQT